MKNRLLFPPLLFLLALVLAILGVSGQSAASDGPSDVPSDVPSMTPAFPAPSSVPTVPRVVAPTVPKTCSFSYNTGRCSGLMTGFTAPTERCDCYTFCGNTFIGCKDFEEFAAPSIPGDCASFNEVTGGCTKDSAGDRGGSTSAGAGGSVRGLMPMVFAAGGLFI